MLTKYYKWVHRQEPDEHLVQFLANKFNLSLSLIKLFISRGYDTEYKIKKFIFSDSVIYLSNPFILSDMEEAVKIVREHIDKKSKILIWGDRDVDGITSVVLLYRTLKNLGCEPYWYIPQTEGYGLNKEVIDKYKSEVNLVITVDCGISSFEEIKYLKELEIDVVITDHHEPPEEIYEFRQQYRIPVLNPYLKDYPDFKDLAGVGVVLKFVWALMLSFDKKYINKNFVVIDIETTGLSPEYDEICELAAVKMRNFVPKENFHTLVKPKKGIPAQLTKIHGITNEMVNNAPYIEDVLPKFLEFIGNDTIVAHNADFDLSFINYNLKKFGYDRIKNEIVDTLAISRQYFPLQSHSLDSLCSDFMLKNLPKHRALDDVYATIELFYYLYYFINTKIRFFIEDNLDLVCLGTISDIMPLIEDNRIIVKKGLEIMSKPKKPAIRLLTEHLRKKSNDFTAESVSWYVIPLLNAAGRMQKVEYAVEFLLKDTEYEAKKYFFELEKINYERRILQEMNFTKFYELIEEQCDIKNDLILIVVAENVEHGVTGVIANHIVKEFNRPVVLLILDGEIATGAVRSPKGLNIYKILKQVEHLFEKFGGHEYACGLTIRKDKIEVFKQEIKKLVKDIPPPIIEIDTEISLEDITTKFVRELSIIEPCGAENPYPKFLIKNVKVANWKYFGSTNKYVKIEVQTGDRSLECICWDVSGVEDLLRNFNYFNLVGELEISNNEPRVIVLDLQPVI